MTFQYPYALFALLAIPVLILIYILRNRYKEETAPSTYLWELSEKFLKKRNPLRRMENLLALIVQILAIAGMSFALAHPQFTLPGQADNIVFVLDASGSMKMNKSGDEGTTRFDAAKAEIAKTAEDATGGSKFSLIIADENPRVVCKSVTDITTFEMYLDTLRGSESPASLDASMNMAQELFSDGTSNVCYLATDKYIQDTKTLEENNIHLIDVSSGTFDDKATHKKASDDQINYALTSLDYTIDSKTLDIKGTFVDYNDFNFDKLKLKIRFYVTNSDGDELNCGYINKEQVSDKDDSTKDFLFTVGDDLPFSVSLDNSDGKFNNLQSIRAVIENKDVLALDNSYTVYNHEEESATKVLIVSDQPFYLQSALKVLSNRTIRTTTISTSSYKSAPAGYDIYVYDSFAPYVLPKSGAVWLFNVDYSIPDSGVIYQSEGRFTDDEDHVTLSYSNNTDDPIYQQLTAKATATTQVLVSAYQRYSLTGTFTPILSNGNVPFVFAGKNLVGQREVVFNFDLHNSDFPLQYDYLNLIRNMVDYSNPILLKNFIYQVNDTATFALSDDIKKIEITTPNKSIEPLDDSASYVDYVFSEVGTYTIDIEYDNNSKKSVKLFASYPKEEENPVVNDTTKYALVANQNTVKGDGIFDGILPVVIAAAVLFALDWILYAHEQY